MTFIHKRTVLFGECDPIGIIYTPRISDYLVEASLAFLSHRLNQPCERYLAGLGVGIPARALNIEFLKSMTWDEVISTKVTLEKIGSSSLTLSATGRNASGDLTYTGQITLVFISAADGNITSIPGEIRRSL